MSGFSLLQSNLFQDLFKNAKVFYKYAGWRLFALMLITSASAILGAIGIVSLLPVLNYSFNKLPEDAISKYIILGFDYINVNPSLANLLIGVSLIFIFRGIAMIMQIYYSSYVVINVKQDVRLRLVSSINKMAYKLYFRYSSGKLTNTLHSEVDRFASSLRAFTRMVVSVLYSLIYIPAALFLHAELTLIIILVGACSLSCMYFITRNVSGYSKKVTSLNNKIHSKMIQMIHSYTYLKATNSSVPVVDSLGQDIESLSSKNRRITLRVALLEGVREPIAVITLSVFTYYQVILQEGNMAEVLVLSVLLYRLMLTLLYIPGEYQNYLMTSGGVNAVVELLEDLELKTEKYEGTKKANLNGDIILNNVVYKYDNKLALDNITLKIKPNETIGIVGESGAGKTTLFYLLTGLLKPTSGNISIANVDYRDIDMLGFRGEIGYVTQDSVLFNDTILNNVSLWDSNFDKEKFDNVVKAAKCDEFISTLPELENTTAGERGSNFSGGQKQRIAIARELYKEPKILIFDEATSSLDAKSEKYVQEEIDDMKGEKTIMIISHRLSTIRHCDNIYVLSSGKIVEEGTFDELYSNENTLFYSMCKNQGINN